LALNDCAVGNVTVRAAIEAAPIAPLSLEASAVGAIGTTTFPNLIALTTLVVVAYGSDKLTPVMLMLLFVVVPLVDDPVFAVVPVLTPPDEVALPDEAAAA
jgi:hypothetical protein